MYEGYSTDTILELLVLLTHWQGLWIRDILVRIRIRVHWLTDPDSDPDPAFFFNDEKMPTKNKFFSKFLCLLIFEGTFTLVFIDKKLWKYHNQTVNLRLFLSSFPRSGTVFMRFEKGRGQRYNINSTFVTPPPPHPPPPTQWRGLNPSPLLHATIKHFMCLYFLRNLDFTAPANR